MSKVSAARALAHEDQRRDRSAFGYFEPDVEERNFAQCLTCRMWVAHPGRCVWQSEDFEVKAGDSCIMYVPGEPIYDAFKPLHVFDPEEVGFVSEKVRCENCISSNGHGQCMFYRTLNVGLPRFFDLDVNIKPQGCCNAFSGE